MTQLQFIRFLVMQATFLACLVACVASPRVQVATVELVWPPQGGAEKITYLYQFSGPSDLGIRGSFIERVTSALSGRQLHKELANPYGLTKGQDGTLYIVDTKYPTIHAINENNLSYTFFPRRPVPGFRNPVNIVVGSNGRIFVSDSVSGLIHVFDEDSLEHVSSFGEELLERPTGIALNRNTGELLITDTKNSVIVVFDEATLSYKKTIGNKSNNNTEEVFFHYPTNITTTPDGNVIVSDSLNFRIQVLDSNLRLLKQFGNPGNAPGDFSRPKGLATDSNGNIYVVDAIFDNIQVFSRDGDLQIAVGGPGSAPGKFWLPNSVFIDATDRIYVSDAYNHRIQVFQFQKLSRTE